MSSFTLKIYYVKFVNNIHYMTSSFELQAFFNMEPHLSGQNVKLFDEGMKAQFRSAYRNRKNKFKKEHFVEIGGYEHPEEIRNFPPGNMSLSDWHLFCTHVTSKKHLKRSQANKGNRGKQLYTSNHGSKSYAQSRHEEVSRYWYLFLYSFYLFQYYHISYTNLMCF